MCEKTLGGNEGDGEKGYFYRLVGRKKKNKKGYWWESLKGWNLNQEKEWSSVEKECEREEREREGLSFRVGLMGRNA